MAKKFFLRNTTRSTCLVGGTPDPVDYDLNETQGTSAAWATGASTDETNGDLMGTFDIDVSGISRSGGTLNVSIDIASLTKGEVRVRPIYVNSSCTAVANGTYSSWWTGTGVQTYSPSITLPGTETYLRLEVYVRRASGQHGNASATINVNDIDTWVEGPTWGATTSEITFDADARLLDRLTSVFDADAILSDRLTSAFDADTLLVDRIDPGATFDADVRLLDRLAADFLADALLTDRLDPGASFDADTLLIDRLNVSFDADVRTLDRSTETFDADTQVRDPLTQRMADDGATQQFQFTGSSNHFENVDDFPLEFGTGDNVYLRVSSGPIGAFGRIERFIAENIPGPQRRGQVVEIETYARVGKVGVPTNNQCQFAFQIRRDGVHTSPTIDLLNPDIFGNDVERSYIFTLKDPNDPNSSFTWDDLLDMPVEIVGTVFTIDASAVELTVFNVWNVVRRWQELEPFQYPLPAYVAIGVWAIGFNADVHLVDRKVATFASDVIVGSAGIPSKFKITNNSILDPVVSRSVIMRSNIISNAVIMHPVVSKEGVFEQ